MNFTPPLPNTLPPLFLELAEKTLKNLQDQLDSLLDEEDVDHNGGSLSIQKENGKTHLLSIHTPTEQLWLSSPISGASHYTYDPTLPGWRSTRPPYHSLKDLLNEEFHISLSPF
jgi:frataxin